MDVKSSGSLERYILSHIRPECFHMIHFLMDIKIDRTLERQYWVKVGMVCFSWV